MLPHKLRHSSSQKVYRRAKIWAEIVEIEEKKLFYAVNFHANPIFYDQTYTLSCYCYPNEPFWRKSTLGGKGDDQDIK